MPNNNNFESKHFTLEALRNSVYACVHKPGGAAYSNAGILDLGDRTLLVDAFNTLVAGRDLRQAAETLFGRPVDTIVLTHPHSDHWIGASAFDLSTMLLTTKTIRQVCTEWGEQIMQDFQNPAEWDEWLAEMEGKLKTERDESARLQLEKEILQIRYVLAEIAEYEPRYADQTFEDSVTFQGSKRQAELRSLGRGHSEEDIVLLLPQDSIAFIGDIGFFDMQPFLGYCDIDRYRQQLYYFQNADYGGKQDLALQLEYFDVMEDLVGEVAQKGGSFEEALRINLPEPFDKWLVGSQGRFKANVAYLFARFGGEVPEME
jgi:cyclase